MSNKVVYGWYKNGELFYIGIGSRKRSYSRYSRNKYCLSVRSKAEKEGTFSVEILFEDLTWEQACMIECQLIQQYGRRDLGTGCLTNMTDGGEGKTGAIFSDEHKEKLRKRLQDKNHPMNQFGVIGSNHPAFGHTVSQEEKNKLSELAKKRFKGKGNPMYGRKGKNHPRSKPVMTPLGEFENSTIGAKENNISRTAFQNRLKSPNFPEFYLI